MKFEYEIRQIEAWADIDSLWTWNDSYHIGNFSTRAENHKRAFLNALHNLGIVCKRGKCKVEFDGSIYELVDRKTLEPLFAAVPLNH
jgi:hypothetical protein